MLSSALVAESLIAQAMLGSAILEWLSSAWSILLMILGFSVVIFVHELGHFVMAKLAGVRVDKFAIGFGKELLGYTYGETRYSFNILPLGGYVKMLGQEDFEIDKAGEWKVKQDPRAFTNKSVGSRMLIVSAGVVMNLIFAAIAFMIVFMIGLKTTPPRIGYVEPGSPAEQAGLLPGDTILRINDATMDDHSDVKRSIMLADSDRPIHLEIRREGKSDPLDVHIEPKWSELSKVRQIGILPAMTLQVRGISHESGLEEGQEDRLQFGDTIIEVDGVKVDNLTQVEELITRKRGADVKILVDRPVDEADLEGPTKQVTCFHRARMTIHPTSGSFVGQHLLGLVPRTVLVQVEPSGPGGRAGLQAGDIVVRWGDQWHPTAEECMKMLLAKDEDGQYVHNGRDIEIVVRRVGLNKELGGGQDQSAGTIVSHQILEPLLDKRDTIITLAREDAAAARKQVLDILDKATDDKALLAEVGKSLDLAGPSAPSVINWLVDLDRDTFVVRPKSPGWWGNKPPRAGIGFGGLAMELDRIAVAKLIEKDLDGRPTPVGHLKIPRGSLVTHVNDTRVRTWVELAEASRKHAGQQITLTYTHEGIVTKGKVKVPMCVKAALDLAPMAEITHIAGEKRTSNFKWESKASPASLPFWGAAREILKENVGKTVPITYRYSGKEITSDPNGRPLTYAVTDENYDPWLMRVGFKPMLITFPEFILLQKKNPLAAMWMGYKKTMNFILSAYKTLEHVIFTQKVGVEHVSGPIGILRIGHQVAQSGFVNLLYFLAFISANLAVINFLPLPIVDGGLFVFLILEKIRGRAISIKMQVVTQIIGLALILGIFVLVTFMDISKWVTEG